MAPDPARFAALLCDYCLEVEPGQQVVVRSSTLATPLLLAMQRRILERDAWPLLRPDLTVQAPENTRSLSGVDPARLTRGARARAPVREAAPRRRWCVSVWPTPALA